MNEELCKCRMKDPICTRCRKPQRLCRNWYYDIGYDGHPKWTNRQHLTKKQTEGLKKLVEYFVKTPIDQIIDMKKLRREYGKMARKHLKLNGIPTKGLNQGDCISLQMQHTRAFLGMDAPNVFTGVK